MPNINRIRVNNVKYNFGTQQYDNFTMRLYGKNTLYDLANGGGKSVLMLLLLQNMIPNCTLDEKQPIEKLFRNGCGNTVIHSLIEWKLDEHDMQEGYRYMTTGFCARKAKDADEGNVDRDTASIEYFNYCIFYRDYNENDIMNLPLESDGERISYTGLKNYLKDLARRDLSLEIRVFERKGEYQRFISSYGIYESEWEIIRGINKTEGHVRTYFETNYKTARKVVEDLLIEEIIEKAYLVKVDQNEQEHDMAKALLDIKDKLVELSKKKSEIHNFDREMELIHVLLARVNSFLSLYEEKQKLSDDIANVYVTGQQVVKELNAKLEVLEAERMALQQQMNEQKRTQESLKVYQNQFRLQEGKEEITKLEGRYQLLSEEAKKLEEELAYKESANDYLDYLKDKALKEEQQAIIDAARDQNEDQTVLLKSYAAEKKKRNQKREQELGQHIADCETALKELAEKKKQLANLIEEARMQFAIAGSDKKKASGKMSELQKEIAKLRGELHIMTFGDDQNLLTINEEQQKTLRNEIADLETQVYELQCAYYEQTQAYQQKKDQLDTESGKQEELASKRNESGQSTEKLQKMMTVYGLEKRQDLLNAIQNRYLAGIVELGRLEEQQKQLLHRKKELEQQRLIGQTQTLDKVKNYIETRHGFLVMSGMDYVAARLSEEKDVLLSKHPLLPYGLIVEEFDELREDRNLAQMNLGNDLVPIFSKQALDTMVSLPENNCMMFVHRSKDAFLDEKVLAAELRSVDEAVRDTQNDIKQYQEMNDIYLEDMAFLKEVEHSGILEVESHLEALEISLRKGREEEKVLQNQVAETGKLLEKQHGLLTDKKKELEGLIADARLCDQLVRLSRSFDEQEEDFRKAQAEELRLNGILLELKTKESNALRDYSDYESRYKEYQRELEELVTVWKEWYADYFEEGFVLTDRQRIEALSMEELDAACKAARAVANQTVGVLDDKKQLIKTLEISMERNRRTIEKRGITIEYLQQQKQADQLYYVKEEVLAELSLELSRIATQQAEHQNELEKKKSGLSRLEGNIEHAIKTVEEQYGSCISFTCTKEEAERALAEGARMEEQFVKEANDKLEQLKRYEKEQSVLVDLYKDAKRIVDTNDIKLEHGQVLDANQEELQAIFERSLRSYDKSVKGLEKGKAELLRYKTQTSEILYELQAFELAEAIKRDVAVPEDYYEATALVDNLKAMIDVIALEKERVETGIQDMEFMKSNFESQCIQRCHDVRTELEKLPKLSKIILEDEPIQMVGLTIPYVKEEFVAQRMSDYIDDVVKGADAYSDVQERIKYIRNRLVLKKLFSVIVTDMNGIRLTLYKRERIREQSRYLRYEEAVGSTGQSQGIYIQFLVSIINYISGLYAPNADNDKLKKTIFIDNPFGAAKDVYIWEPIFALLQTNHVQLIVPARGATPAITSRFDVNYILGQKLVGGRQQTVVIDYRSQVEQEEIEYTALAFEQVSFDFI